MTITERGVANGNLGSWSCSSGRDKGEERAAEFNSKRGVVPCVCKEDKPSRVGGTEVKVDDKVRVSYCILSKDKVSSTKEGRTTLNTHRTTHTYPWVGLCREVKLLSIIQGNVKKTTDKAHTVKGCIWVQTPRYSGARKAGGNCTNVKSLIGCYNPISTNRISCARVHPINCNHTRLSFLPYGDIVPSTIAENCICDGSYGRRTTSSVKEEPWHSKAKFNS